MHAPRLVPVVAERGGRGVVEIREIGRGAVGPPVGQRRALAVVDVPVQLGDVGLLFGDGIGPANRARVVTERLRGGRDLGGHGGIREEDLAGCRLDALEVHPVQVEKEFVLDDRAAEGGALGALLELIVDPGDGILAAQERALAGVEAVD